jgi:hypothetical protein
VITLEETPSEVSTDGSGSLEEATSDSLSDKKLEAVRGRFRIGVEASNRDYQASD